MTTVLRKAVVCLSLGWLTWLVSVAPASAQFVPIPTAQEICIGFMSGASNVNYWLAKRNIPSDETLVAEILKAAKGLDRIMTEDEVMAVVKRVRGDA